MLEAFLALDGGLLLWIQETVRCTLLTPAAQFYTTLGDEERSGMGFTIMQTFMTTFGLRSAPGEGTTVCMSKRFGGPQADEKARGRLADAQ